MSNRTGLPPKGLFQQLGGADAIQAVVQGLYRRLLEDELTRPFFVDLDVETLVQKQVAFLTVAFDGPPEYRGRDLWVAHRHLVQEHGLNDDHFDALVGHLRAALEDLDVAAPLVSAVCEVVEGTRDRVLRGNAPGG
jgi:hemoglobin